MWIAWYSILALPCLFSLPIHSVKRGDVASFLDGMMGYSKLWVCEHHEFFPPCLGNLNGLFGEMFVDKLVAKLR